MYDVFTFATDTLTLHTLKITLEVHISYPRWFKHLWASHQHDCEDGTSAGKALDLSPCTPSNWHSMSHPGWLRFRDPYGPVVYEIIPRKGHPLRFLQQPDFTASPGGKKDALKVYLLDTFRWSKLAFQVLAKLEILGRVLFREFCCFHVVKVNFPFSLDQ